MMRRSTMRALALARRPSMAPTTTLQAVASFSTQVTTPPPPFQPAIHGVPPKVEVSPSAITPMKTPTTHEEIYHLSEEYLNKGKHHLKSIDCYRAMYEESIKQPDRFWGNIARTFYWEKRWHPEHTVRYNFDSSKDRIHSRWFDGGLTNITYNALDRHVLAGNANRVCFYTERNELEPEPKSRHPHSYTYGETLEEVCRLANVLKRKGIKKGDKVGIFMPMLAELPIAMLACARIGAIHTVVFGGFSKEALAGRLMDAECKAVITANGVYRGNKLVNLYDTMDDALTLCETQGHKIDNVIVLERLQERVHSQLKSGRDTWWHEATSKVSNYCAPEWVDSEHPLFILYTSGSTGKPKGVVHCTAGYMVTVATSFKYIFNVHPDQGDVWFCSADCGWVTGHSYVTYGPLLNGATQVVFEGIPSYPDVGRFWHLVDKYKVSHLYTAPTAIRSLMKEGEHHVKKYSRESLRVLGSVGEPINPEAWKWYHSVVGEGRCPIVDTWWQTETGTIMIAPLPVKGWGQKPGSATLPFFGVQLALLTHEGKEVEGQAEGLLAIKGSWPSTIRSIHNDHDRMESTYFSFPGYYLTGDNARRDGCGYYWITGRADDVCVVSGHNIGTAEVESALTTLPEVAEAAVVGVPHDIKGNTLYCYVTLATGVQPSKELVGEMKKAVRQIVGAFASPDFIHWAPQLPKTRSGKIMRRILRKIALLGHDVTPQELGDTSTLAEPEVVRALIKSHPTKSGNKNH